MILFDHYTNQEKESVAKFIRDWGQHPWDDANIPVGLSIYNADAGLTADIMVFHPRKEHVKHVFVIITSDEEMQMLRDTFVGVSGLFVFAGNRLEAWAHGWNGRDPDDEKYHKEGDRSGRPLYYWGGYAPRNPAAQRNTEE